MSLTIYCLLIFLAALAGGGLPSIMRLNHTRMQLAMSLIGGLMLGVAVLHLLPHSIVASQSVDRSVQAVVAGLLGMFFLIRIFHVHQHAPAEDAVVACDHGVAHAHGVAGPLILPMADSAHEHHPHLTHAPRPARYSWCGLAVGLSLHTLIDGMALAASVAVEQGEHPWGPALGPFFAILLHKPLDALSITTVMNASGWSRRWTWTVSALFAAVCPLGAVLFVVGLRHFFGGQETVLGWALGFSAGVFLCISLSDLLPEVQFHTHDRWKLSGALLLGVLVAYGITFLEPAHLHQSEPSEMDVPHHGGHDRGHEGHRESDLPHANGHSA